MGIYNGINSTERTGFPVSCLRILLRGITMPRKGRPLPWHS